MAWTTLEYLVLPGFLPVVAGQTVRVKILEGGSGAQGQGCG